MLRLLVEENRRFKSRQVGKCVLWEQKPAVNYSYGWNSPGFPKAHLQKQYTSTKTVHVQLFFVWFPHTTSMVCSIRCFFVSHEFGRWTSTRFPPPTQPTPVSPQAVSPCGGYLAVANAMTVTVLTAQIWIKLQKVIEIPTSFQVRIGETMSMLMRGHHTCWFYLQTNTAKIVQESSSHWLIS